jgi:hypothetical protein
MRAERRAKRTQRAKHVAVGHAGVHRATHLCAMAPRMTRRWRAIWWRRDGFVEAVRVVGVGVVGELVFVPRGESSGRA